MAFKKPLRTVVIPSDTTVSATDMIKEVFEKFKDDFNEYADGVGVATVTDHIVNDVRLIDLLFSMPGCNYGWILSANTVSETQVRVYWSHVNINTGEVIRQHYNALYDKTGLGITRRQCMYCLVSDKTFIFNILLASTPTDSEKMIFTGNYTELGISPLSSGNYAMIYSGNLASFLAGTTTVLATTPPQVISQLAGTCVVRKVLFSNGDTLLDEDIKLLNSARGIGNMQDWYLYLKNSGVYYCVGANTCVSIYRINEDARSVR